MFQYFFRWVKGVKNMVHLLLINGPNLNLLGKPEPHIYGSTTLHEFEQELMSFAGEQGAELTCFQSNHEGAIMTEFMRRKENTTASF
jgi:3-dehydroquinate dehydratase